MKNARDVVHQRLSQVKSFLAQESPPRLSESDTKANFIEPIITALGWEGIGVVTREYYVRNSQEFIDYVMRGPEGRLLLAIEAKPLRTDLSDKHAAQLIQYCAVEGIEWAALTNGRELQFFNTFLKPDLAAKRVLQLDLLAYNTDEEFDALFGQIWQLSRESMTKPKGIRTWLNQLRLDTALRSVLLDPSSSTNRYLRRILSDQDISANSQEVAQWFLTHLSPPITVLPPGRQRQDEKPETGSPVSEKPRGAVPQSVSLGDLVDSGLLAPGTRLTLIGRGSQEVTQAELTRNGEISWNGQRYRSPSDRAFIELVGWKSMNGWIHWVADLPHGREQLSRIRDRYRELKEQQTDSVRIEG